MLYTKSTPFIALSKDLRSRRSPKASSTPHCCNSKEQLGSRTNALTEYPLLARRLQRCPPAKPVPPVTRTLITLFSSRLDYFFYSRFDYHCKKKFSAFHDRPN